MGYECIAGKELLLSVGLVNRARMTAEFSPQHAGILRPDGNALELEQRNGVFFLPTKRLPPPDDDPGPLI